MLRLNVCPSVAAVDASIERDAARFEHFARDGLTGLL
jgi:hypothetical protein